MKLITTLLVFLNMHGFGQNNFTTFEISQHKETTTYENCIKFYKNLAKKYKTIHVKEIGVTDANLPLHIIVFNRKEIFTPTIWHQNKFPVFFINNGIHPGEPDGIDATMMYIRDIAMRKIIIADNMVIATIPIYNIGGALQRNSSTRVNQNGPNEYGFRGNSQNLDLNRDFIKCDTREALLFSKAFHYIKPTIFLDTHVSDGADYQHTITLLTTHHNKLEPKTDTLLHNIIEPAIYRDMKTKNWDLIPYVNFEDTLLEKGWAAFYDSPRYSTGYTSLFNCIGFMSETHMLKPFEKRVKSTYDLIVTLANICSKYVHDISQANKFDTEVLLQKTLLPSKYIIDSTLFDTIIFKGYETAYKESAVTGLTRLYYNRSKPFTSLIRFYNYLKPGNSFEIPDYYIIPQGWHEVINRLIANNISINFIQHDTTIQVKYCKIDQYKSSNTPFEKHHRNTTVQFHFVQDKISFRKGDAIINSRQAGKKFLHAVLSLDTDDSYFSWNFFDAILQQKEGYSNYRWEDIAADILLTYPEIKQELETKKRNDKNFANNVNAQLDFVYKKSNWYEKPHLLYPVFFLNKN